MKVTIEVDCTPLEARQFLGLPDVQPLQAAVLAEMEKRMVAEAAKFSPDGFLRAWFAESQNSAEWFQNALRGMFAQAGAANREPPKA